MDERLGEIRKEINKVDKNILSEIEARVKLTKEVAEIKAETLAPVFVPAREKEIIAELTAQASDEVKNIVPAVFSTLIRLSRRDQYALIYKKLEETEFAEQLSGAVSKVAQVDKSKRPCIELVFRDREEVCGLFDSLADYGFYPLEFSFKEKKSATGVTLVARCLFDAIEQNQDREKMLIKAMYQLCNEFEDVKLVGWI